MTSRGLLLQIEGILEDGETVLQEIEFMRMNTYVNFMAPARGPSGPHHDSGFSSFA